MRTFIASPVTRTEGIEDLLSQVSLLPSVRVPRTRDLHLTYLFLGDIGERDVKSASEAVKAISLRKVVSGFSEITAFPDLSNPRVLVLIFDNPGILEIYKRISDLL
ncbi:MAG: 2'-5' RNA ligase family protein, partial [Thermoplasmataceae archaeon]